MSNRTVLLLLQLLLPLPLLLAQTADSCVDKVFIRGGSVFRGHLVEYVHGEKVILQTNTGARLHLPAREVKRVVQYCPGEQTNTQRWERPYTFRERGWYSHTRLAALPGRVWYGEPTLGLSLYSAAGFQLNRLLGVGIGVGVEAYEPGGVGTEVTYPIFAEVRGYLSPRRVSAYYAAAAGYGLTGSNAENPGNWRDGDWTGGWMAKTQIGVRFGNHFSLHTGLSFQRATLNWTSPWNPGESGYERRLFKRMEVGIGVLL